METGEKRKRRKMVSEGRVLRGLVEMLPTNHYVPHTIYIYFSFYYHLHGVLGI